MVGTRNSNLLHRITIPLIICCLVTVGLCVHTASALPGSGTQQDPFRIQSLADFDEFAADPNYWAGHTRLETDVNLAGRTYSTAVIAPDTDSSTSWFEGTAFTGIFDGNAHKIVWLTIDDGGAGNDYLGLFGYIGGYAEVRNLRLEGGSISGDYWVGGLVGLNSGSVSNCYSTGDVSGDWSVGGLVGTNNHTITNCYSTGAVSGIGSVGGLVGINDFGSISDCYSTGDVNGVDDVGGLVGSNGGSVSNCYSTGDVNGVESVGGLVGDNDQWSISNCYSTGSVSGDRYVGGLVGGNYWSTLTSCYATGSVSGDYEVGGLVGNNEEHLITSCYATGSVSGTENVGGLVGAAYNSTLTFCYATGLVSGDYGVGGLVAYNENYENGNGLITACFWDTQTSGQTRSSGGGMGFPTSIMQDSEIYLRVFWDFKGETRNGINDTWVMPQGGGYPVLAWQLGDLPVSNDEMSNAIPVTVGSTVSGTSIGATGLDITRNGYNDSADVWYYFDCTETDKYTITVEADDFDSTLAVFDEIQREIAFNDDFFGNKSVVILKAAAGRRYYIRVAGYDGQTGDFTLNIIQGAIQAIQGDLNYDGMVNLVDFALLADHWLEGRGN